MTSSDIKIHVMQENNYDQKYPQTNSKQVLLENNSTLDVYLKEGTNLRFENGKLVYKDPVTGADRIMSTSSLASRSIGNVSNVVLESLLNMANIKWEDPKDTTIATSGDSVTITSWMGTKVVVKEGSIPKSEIDGTLLVDSKIRDQYKMNGLELTGLEPNKTYFVKLFPYTSEGVVTNDNTNMVTVDTRSSKLDPITDIGITPVGGTLFIRLTDPENKTGTYKGHTYTISEYAGTKIVAKQGSAPSNQDDGVVLADYTTRNQHSTNATILKSNIGTEGLWFLAVYNYTTDGIISLAHGSSHQIDFLPIGNVTGLSVTSNKLAVTVKWSDPANVTHFLETDHTVAEWSNTKLVRKVGSEPVDVNDGTVLLINTTRNQYASNGYIDTTVQEGITYFYKLFPQTKEGKITNNSANGKNIIPIIPDDDSGAPGPLKLIAGDKTEGYYGVVPNTDLISGPDLTSMLGGLMGTSINTTEGWLKFHLDGKILFVAKKPFRTNISWDHLNSKGLVTGTKIININGSSFKVRLMRGAKNNPATLSVSDMNARDSEWNRLMLPIHMEAPNNWTINNIRNDTFAGTTKNWGVGFTDNDLMLDPVSNVSLYTWCQEKVEPSDNARILRGNAGISGATYLLSNAQTGALGWRPVLEYVGPAFEDVSGSPGGTKTVSRSDKDGFFGEVPADKFISGTTLASQIGLSGGVSQFGTEGWLKFYSEGKILFVAKKPIRHSISWSQLNDVNAISGERTININGLTYKVRLIKGALTNPSIFDNPDKGAKGSEWNRLMLPIHEQAKNKTWNYPAYVENNTPDWNIGYTDNDLISNSTSGNGSYTWCQETASTSAGARVIRGHNGISWAHVTDISSSTSLFGWRPVLELVQ